jgi:hypothetical protein
LIVAHEVTNNGIDRDQLASMAKLARNEMGVEKLTAVADRGYYKSEEILACHQAGTTVFVPKTVTSSATAHGRFTEGFSHFVTSIAAPVASGWSGCRVGLAPTGKRHLFTAHTHCGPSQCTEADVRTHHDQLRDD